MPVVAVETTTRDVHGNVVVPPLAGYRIVSDASVSPVGIVIVGAATSTQVGLRDTTVTATPGDGAGTGTPFDRKRTGVVAPKLWLIVYVELRMSSDAVVVTAVVSHT